MEEGLRTQLETHWRNIDEFYSYSVWDEKRQGDWKRVISHRLPELGKSIAVDSGLFERLQSKAVFDRRTIETFKQEVGRYAQVSSILHALNKQSFAGFVAFCECLIDTGQTKVIVDYLTPELQDLHQQLQPALSVDVRHVAGNDAASLQALGVVDWRPEEQFEPGLTDEESMRPAASAADVDYDWKSMIRENFMQLTEHIDPDSGLLNELLSRSVISHVSADVIRSKKGRVNRVGAILDHVTQFRPAADFLKLCEALDATNQQDVVRQYLTKDSVHMAHQASAWAENPSQVVVGTDYSRQGKLVDTWRTVLIQKRSAITNSLQSSDDFVDRLVMYGVMNAATGELCREEPVPVARSQFILDYMQRRVSVDMAYFCQALDDTAQHDVVQEFFQQQTTLDKHAASHEPRDV